MLKKLGLVELIKAIQDKIQKTGYKCYDAVPLNAKSPFYFAELVGKKQADTKTMFCDVFTVWIHAIAEPNNSNVSIYNLIEKLEESLTDDIELSGEFNLIMQTELGLQTIKIDETNEKHAVIAYEFKVSYGFKTKV